MVQGLGTRQENQRRYTEAKIVTFLSIQPCTLEELWKITKIQKNTLVTRLSSLVERGLIIKHRFLMQFDNQCYGYLEQINYKPNVKFKRFYYILNMSHLEIDKLITLYYEFQIVPLTNSKSINYYKKKKGDDISEGQIKELWKIEKECRDAIVEGEKKMQEKKKEFTRLAKMLYFYRANEIEREIKEGKILDHSETIAEKIKEELDKEQTDKIDQEIKDEIIDSLPIKYHFLTIEQEKLLTFEQKKKYNKKKIFTKINTNKKLRLIMLVAAERKIKLPRYNSLIYSNDVDFIIDLRKVIKFFEQLKYSFYDIIIRITLDPVIETDENKDIIFYLDIPSYLELCEILKEEQRYLKIQS